MTGPQQLIVASIADDNYQLRIQTVAGFAATLPDGTEAFEGWANTNSDIITTAQNAEEVAAWCAQSPTVAITIDKEGVSDPTHVDFGGNDDSDIDYHSICVFIAELFGYDPIIYCNF